TTTPPAMAARLLRSRRKASLQNPGERWAKRGASSVVVDAGIEVGIGHVGEEIHQHEGGGHHQQRALHHRIVAREDAFDEEAAHSTSAGRTRCASVPAPPEGNQRSFTAKIRMASRPSQKMGSEMPTREPSSAAMSRAELRRVAATMPATTPSVAEIRMARKASFSVNGKRCPSSVATGWRDWMETPRSPTAAWRR